MCENLRYCEGFDEFEDDEEDDEEEELICINQQCQWNLEENWLN